MQKCIISIMLLATCLSRMQAEQQVKKVVSNTTISKVVNPGDQRLLDAINSLTEYISTLESEKSSETILIIQDLFTQMSSWNIDLKNIHATIIRLLESLTVQNNDFQQDITNNIEQLKIYFSNINTYQQQTLSALSSLKHMSIDPDQLASFEASQRQLIHLTQLLQQTIEQQSYNGMRPDHLDALNNNVDQLHLHTTDIAVKLEALSQASDTQSVLNTLDSVKKQLDSNAQQTAQMLQAINNCSSVITSVVRTAISGLQDTLQSLKEDIKKMQFFLEQSNSEQDSQTLAKSLYTLQKSHDTLVGLIAHLPTTAQAIKELTATTADYTQSIRQLISSLATQESSDIILGFVKTLKMTLNNLQSQQNDLVVAFNALANAQKSDAMVSSLDDIKRAIDQTNQQIIISFNALAPQQSNLQSLIDKMQNNIDFVASESQTISHLLSTYNPQDILQSISALKDTLLSSSQTLIKQFETVVASSDNPHIISQLTSLQNQVTILKASLDQSTTAVNNLITINNAHASTLNNQITSLNNVLSTNMLERTPIATPGIISSPGSYYLVNDLNNVGGITIAANNVILDLNNHAITNTDQALVIQDGIHDVKISRGHIYNIAHEAILIGSNTQSIYLDGIHITNVGQLSKTAAVYCKGTIQFPVQHNVFKDLHIKNTHCGIELNNTYNTIIEHCHITQSTQNDAASGIVIINDDQTVIDVNNVIKNCRISDIISTTQSAVGISLTGSPRSCVVGTLCKNIIGMSYAYGYQITASAGTRLNKCFAYNIHALTSQAPAFGIWVESSAHNLINDCLIQAVGSVTTSNATNGALLLSNSSYSALNDTTVLNVEGTGLSFGICTYNSSQVHINNSSLCSIKSSMSAAGLILGGDHPTVDKCSIDTINGDTQAYGVYVSGQNGIPSALSLNATPLNGAQIKDCFVQNVSTLSGPSAQAIGYFVNTLDGTYLDCGARDILSADGSSQAQGMYIAPQSINTIFEGCRVQNISNQAQGFAVNGTGICLNNCWVNAVEGEGIMLSGQAHTCLVQRCVVLHTKTGIDNQSTDSAIFNCLSSSNSTNYKGVNLVTQLGTQQLNGNNIQGL